MVKFCWILACSLLPVALVTADTWDFVDDGGEITKFHVNTNIQMRFAVTEVEAQIINSRPEEAEIVFEMYIPSNAFVSNFYMVIEGKTYQAKVKTMFAAETAYADSENSSAIALSTAMPEFTDGQYVST